MFKSFIYGIAGLILFSSVGYTSILLVETYNRKQEMKAMMESNLPKTSFAIFKYATTDYGKIAWHEDDREFFVGDDLYDVIRQERSQDSITLYCLNDKTETALLGQFETSLAQKGQTSKIPGFDKLFKQLIADRHPLICNLSFPPATIVLHYSHFKQPLSEAYLQVLLKPPIIPARTA